MSRQRISTSREFRRRFTLSSLIVSLLTIAFISAYLLTLLSLAAAERRHFGLVLAALFPVLFAATQFANSRKVAPIYAFLAAEEQAGADLERARRAYAALSSLPLYMFVAGLAWWSVGGLLVAIAMRLRFESLQAYVFLILCLASASGGFIASTFHYFINKSICRDLLEAVAERLPDADERRRHVTSVTLRRKLMVSVTGVSLVTIIFAMFLSLIRSGESLERNATRGQAAWVAGMIAGAADLDDAGWEAAAEDAKRLQIAEHLVLLDRGSRRIVRGSLSSLSEVEIEHVLREDQGSSGGFDSPNAFSWAALPGSPGSVLVAASSWAAVRGEVGVSALLFIGTVMTTVLISFLLALCLSRDLGSRTLELKEAAERLASGDLRSSVLLEAEDEIGELARAFEAMAGALRTAVGGVVTAANLIETTASDIASITEAVSGGADAQRSGVHDAVASMERVNSQVGGISSAAQELNMLVEESSSSILEMGAAGDELNDTAGVLSSRVEEVSSSIEQMVRSVKEVSCHAGSLSEAASETSSSMEEMASAMRQVDNIAEEAARLSRHVVEAAEGGRETVRQTIDGMESIRQATAAAEQVIGGLGSRAKEIGSILDVIDDVADETNLLALNAAIIAAQAGEHGRAFSVVADEIKELADRVLASTKEIGDLIRSVQEESERAIGAIADGAKSVASGVDRSNEAGKALEQITSASRESGQRILEIVRSVQEQSKAASHVVEMMDRVNNGVEAIHAATGEQNRGNEVVFRSAVAMREVAQQLSATTQEQSRGGARIRESIDGVRIAVESINGALQSQSRSCQEVVGFLEEVSAGSQANDVSSERLAHATRVLLDQAEALRQGVRRFVLDS